MARYFTLAMRRATHEALKLRAELRKAMAEQFKEEESSLPPAARRP